MRASLVRAACVWGLQGPATVLVWRHLRGPAVPGTPKPGCTCTCVYVYVCACLCIFVHVLCLFGGTCKVLLYLVLQSLDVCFCVCTCLCVRGYVCVFVYLLTVFVWRHLRGPAAPGTPKPVCVCACTYVHVYVCAYLCIRVCVFVCVCCVYVYLYVCVKAGGCKQKLVDGGAKILGWTPLTPPPPKPPFRCPHPDKKGTILLLYQIGIHLHSHHNQIFTCCRVMGQKLRRGTLAYMTCQAPTSSLKHPQIAFLSSAFNCASCVGTILQVWSD